MEKNQVNLLDQERQFDIEELFFSVTDQKGVIQFGNNVFTRISAYAEEELIGAPHNIIRHPDMPRSVFQLLWDYIEAGKTIGAYVKNLAKDGCYYWVMAIVMPCPNGYLSVRLKPSSPFFDVIKTLYRDILAVEQNVETGSGTRKDAINAGVDRLQTLLEANNFQTYDEFMWAALRAEMVSRESQLTDRKKMAVVQLKDKELDHLGDLYRHCQRLEHYLKRIFAGLDGFCNFYELLLPKSDYIRDFSESVRKLSINAEVTSSRLPADKGRTLAVVAEKMGRHTSDNLELIQNLNQSLTSLAAPLGQLSFDAIVSKLQTEMSLDFLEELLQDTGAEKSVSQKQMISKNIALLTHTFLDRIGDILPRLDQLSGNLSDIWKHTSHLQSFLQGLGFIHLLGLIEATKTDGAEAFKLIFQTLRKQAEEADKEFKDLEAATTANLNRINQIKAIQRPIHTTLDVIAKMIK